MADNPYPYPGPNVSQAYRLMVPVGVTLGLCLILYGIRIWARTHRNARNLGWDDYMITLAMICAIAQTGTVSSSSPLTK